MKIRWIKWIVLVIILLFVFSSCGVPPTIDFPLGTFTKDNWQIEFSEKTELEIPSIDHPESIKTVTTHEVKASYTTFAKESKELTAEGFFSAMPETVVFVQLKDSEPCSDQPGAYSWIFKNNILTLTAMKDVKNSEPCTQRKSVLEGAWTKTD